MATEVSCDDAVKTWQYLRLAMIGMVLGLGAAISYERAHVSCFQHSISAYYYTPARGFLVGGLVTIGICLVALRGRTPAEDVLLNLAGAFAPVVALVPTPGHGNCWSVKSAAEARDANVSNNVLALLVVGGIALAVVLYFVGRAHWPRAAVAGWFVAAAVWLVAASFFWLRHTVFVGNAHWVAAVSMFVCIFVVVVINAVGHTGPSVRNRYGIIAWLMALSAGAAYTGKLVGWKHWVFGIEAALIALFAVFWILQTAEEWHRQ